MCSKSLHVIQVKDTGRSFTACSLLPFLKTGATLARVQSVGRSPVSNDCSNIKRNTEASSLARLWSNLPGIPSGPEDFLVGRRLL